MKIISENKGLIVFYLCMVIFTFMCVAKVEATNDVMMMEKNTYFLRDNL